ncbi:MAG: hypothetical protein AABX07_00140 [Nanoarchaeota archaeon]
MAYKNKKLSKSFWIFWLIAILAIAFFLFFGVIGASEGNQRGIITAVEYNSNIIWGANLAYIKTSQTTSQEETYCVNDNSIKNQLTEFSKLGETVTIYYKNNFILWKWQCNGGQSIIYKVEKSQP